MIRRMILSGRYVCKLPGILPRAGKPIDLKYCFQRTSCMKKTFFLFFCLFLQILFGTEGIAADAKKILYVASYHTEKGEWTAGIKAGIDKILSARKDIKLKTVNMDTRLARSQEIKEVAALQARQVILSWKPDLVIVSDDNAAKYLVAPYFKDADLPFVFCGLNWDASVYGFPFKNVTGMIEVQLIRQIIDHLMPFAAGSRIGSLRGDTMSNQKEQLHFETHTGNQFNVRYVSDFSHWKKEFVSLQKETDMIIFGSLGAVDLQEETMGDVKAFVIENTRVPTAAYDAFMKETCLVTLSTIPEEQGEWSAKTALRILDGVSPEEIPMVRNRKGKLYLNMEIAKHLNIKFPIEILERAHLVSAAPKKLLFVNSYHKGYQWSDQIEDGLLRSLGIRTKSDGSLDTATAAVTVKIFRMDTKRNHSEQFKKNAAIRAKKIIDDWQPDIVVTSDDNAAKYLILPYYKKSKIPFVFCGLNGDASIYGLPIPHVTGMLEVSPVRKTVKMLESVSKGNRIGILGADNITNQKEALYHEQQLSMAYSDGKLVSDFDAWKKEYLRLQKTVDMMIHLTPVGIRDWDDAVALSVILEHTQIPTGAVSDSDARYTLLGQVRIAAEQGWWAGKTAMAILRGKPVSHIPVTTNKQSKTILNMALAKHLGIKFPMEILKEASFVDDVTGSGE